MSPTDISNILALVTLLERLTTQVGSITATIQKARSENRDVTDEEVDQHADAYDAAAQSVYDEIDRQRKQATTP